MRSCSRSHAAALCVVVRVDGDDPGHARIASGGDNERDRAADRDAGKRDVAKIELLEKAFDGLGEEGRIIARLWDIGIAMARKVQGIDGEVLGKLGDDLLEEIELRPQRMQKNESRIFAGLNVAELVAMP